MPKHLLVLIFPPLAGLFLLAVGNGYLSTLVTLRLSAAHYSVLIIGLVTAAYYIGLGLGALFSARFLLTIGHIRSYACFAAIAASSALAQALWLNPWWWFALRFIGGWATVGVYLVIESWLLTGAERNMRGRVLAAYMISLYAALALGQLFIGIYDTSPQSPNLALPYVLIGIFCALSLLPMAIIPRVTPIIEHTEALSPWSLARLTPTGVIGSLGGGLYVAAIYSLLPFFLQNGIFSLQQIGYLMALSIIGGMALQYPIGRWSDQHDRQWVLILICACLIVLALLVPLMSRSFITMAISLFLFGGGAFSLYPVSVGHAADRAKANTLVGMSQGMLSLNATGCTIAGPLFSAAMLVAGANGLFYSFALCALLLMLFFVWRRSQRPAPQPIAPLAPQPIQTAIGAELSVTDAMVSGAEEHEAQQEAEAQEAEAQEAEEKTNEDNEDNKST